MNIKENRGLTLVSLILTVIIILIITAAMIYNTKNQLQMRTIQNLKNDIETLNAKVDEYYLKYGELPKLSNYTYPNDENVSDPVNKEDFQAILLTKASGRNASLNGSINPNDGDEYIVIDVEKLGNITLTYGYDDEYMHIKQVGNVVEYDEDPLIVESELYVINTKTHQIYFPHGIFVDDVMYFTF